MTLQELKKEFPEVEWEKYPKCSCSYPICVSFLPKEAVKHHPSCSMADKEKKILTEIAWAEGEGSIQGEKKAKELWKKVKQPALI